MLNGHQTLLRLAVFSLIVPLSCRWQLRTFQAPTRRSVVTSLVSATRRPHRVAEVGLGTSGLHDVTILVKALSLGCRLLDTAAFYGNEEIVGRAVQNVVDDKIVLNRGDITVTTKVWWSELGYDKTRQSVSESLQRLRTNSADMVLLHWPGRWLSSDAQSNRKLREESWKALTHLQQEGKILDIGVSNFNIHHLEEMLSYSDVMPAVNQIEVHPYFQQNGLVKYCQDHGIGVQAYSPLASGRRELLRDPAILEVANSHGLSPAQVVLKWHLQRGLTPIVKTTSTRRLTENLGIAAPHLTASELEILASLDRGASCDFTGFTSPDRIA